MKQLKTNFEGQGEVRGFQFTQIEKTPKAYLYEVAHPDIKKPHYEVFKRRVNSRFGVVSYPSAKAFGIWAWTYPTLQQAREKLAEITWDETCPNLMYESGVFALEIQ